MTESLQLTLALPMPHRESVLEVPGLEIRVEVRTALPGRRSAPTSRRGSLLPASASPRPLQGLPLLRAGSRGDASGALLPPQSAGLGRGP